MIYNGKMITVRKFENEHLAAAKELLMENYLEEKSACKSLPEIKEAPDFSFMLDCGFGVAAFEEEKLVGYMLCFNPWKECFATHAKGTFVPLHGHAASKENRTRIYEKMYTDFSKQLVEMGAYYHAIAFFAHDEDALSTFFNLGFGKRCMDRIRKVEPLNSRRTEGFEFCELPLEDFPKIRDMRIALDTHLTKAPCFMVSIEEDRNNWLEKVEKGDRRTFVAKKDGKICAYMDITREGENFVGWRDDMMDIHGAWCDPEYRGTGLYDDLLDYVLGVAAKEGAKYLGVDHETFNLSALHYWEKHFEAYTNSLARRIDESFLE